MIPMNLIVGVIQDLLDQKNECLDVTENWYVLKTDCNKI